MQDMRMVYRHVPFGSSLISNEGLDSFESPLRLGKQDDSGAETSHPWVYITKDETSAEATSLIGCSKPTSNPIYMARLHVNACSSATCARLGIGIGGSSKHGSLLLSPSIRNLTD